MTSNQAYSVRGMAWNVGEGDLDFKAGVISDIRNTQVSVIYGICFGEGHCHSYATPIPHKVTFPDTIKETIASRNSLEGIMAAAIAAAF